MRRNNNLILMGIIILAALALWVVWPRPEGFSLAVGGSAFERKGLHLGLDLQGGTSLVMEGDLSKVELKTRDQAMDGVARIIERRINAYGVSEPSIQRQGANRILVQLPGVRDVQEAVRLIGKTAQLDFREQTPTPDGNTEWVGAPGPGGD